MNSQQNSKQIKELPDKSITKIILNKNMFGFSNTAIQLSLIDNIDFPKDLIAVDWYFFWPHLDCQWIGHATGSTLMLDHPDIMATTPSRVGGGIHGFTVGRPATAHRAA